MLIPLIALEKVLEARDAAELNALARLGVAGDVYVHNATGTWTADSVAKLKPFLVACQCRVGPFRPADIDAATSILDSGAQSVVFDVDPSASDGASDGAAADAAPNSVAAVAEAISSLPPSRVAVRMLGVALSTEGSGAPAEVTAALQVLRSYITGLILSVTSMPIASETIKSLRQTGGSHVQLSLLPSAEGGGVDVRASEVGRMHRHDVAVIAPAHIAASREEVELGEGAHTLDVGSCVAASVKSDRPDGLFTTVVSDETGKGLGLVYSSSESIVEAIRSGRGVYYSRSRGGLWRKGDTSGNYQELLTLRIDCDGDALLFRVRQKGSVPAFCHLNTRTCWGEDGGLTALERTLAARRVDAPPGSYTKRLFDDHELLKHKLLEEAQELAEATEPDHIAAEAADLLYFAMVACAKAGVTLQDIESHLDRRSLKVRRRAGDSKPARIAAAQAHFAARAAASASASSSTKAATDVPASAASSATGGAGGGGTS